MKNYTKASISIFALAIGSIFISEYSSVADGNSAGAPAGYCGAPLGAAKTCAYPGCHTGAAVTSQTGWITTNIPIAGYTPGATYTITATATRAGHSRFGFEISAQTTAGVIKGTLVNTGTSTQLINSSKYITHTSSGVTGSTGSHTWTFNWIAPATGNGPVTFYGAFNIAGGFINESGDSIFTSQTVVSEDMTIGIDEIKNIAGYISVYPNPITDNFSIKNTLNETGLCSLTISDINGRLVKEIQNVSAYQPVNIEDLSNGCYFLHIDTKNGVVVKKIIKQ